MNLTQVQNSFEELKRGLQSTRVSRAQYLKMVIDYIHSLNPLFHWVGIYIVEPDRKHVRLFDYYIGRRTDHVLIPIDRGICGAAVQEDRTIMLDDVHADPRHIACSLETNSELVVPIRSNGKVVAEIDIDSDQKKAFTEKDRQNIEWIANQLSDII
jgi:L-methionine (R)-S-oxide reductase